MIKYSIENVMLNANTKTQNGYAILCLLNAYRVYFLIHRGVVTLLGIGISRMLQHCRL